MGAKVLRARLTKVLNLLTTSLTTCLCNAKEHLAGLTGLRCQCKFGHGLLANASNFGKMLIGISMKLNKLVILPNFEFEYRQKENL